MSNQNNPDKNKQISVIQLEEKILRDNDIIADEVRTLLKEKRIYAINMISSPGSGKTTLLEKILLKIGKQMSCAVIEGDQQTSRDAERIAATGVPVVQINTLQSCHLNAAQVAESFKKLPIDKIKLLFIENVGNLVCPASMDLGENEKIVLMSVTEGEDKPIKYPLAFQLAHILVLTKVDLIPHLHFDQKLFEKCVNQVNPHLQIIETSSYTEMGLNKLIKYLQNGMLIATNIIE